MAAGTVILSDWFNKETMTNATTAATAWITNKYTAAADQWIKIESGDRVRFILITGA